MKWQTDIVNTCIWDYFEGQRWRQNRRDNKSSRSWSTTHYSWWSIRGYWQLWIQQRCSIRNHTHTHTHTQIPVFMKTMSSEHIVESATPWLMCAPAMTQYLAQQNVSHTQSQTRLSWRAMYKCQNLIQNKVL